MAGFATGFLQQTDVFDAHAAVDGLAHVVNGEQAYRCCGQGFHFDTGSTKTFSDDFTVNGMLGFVDRKIGGDAGQGDRVAKGDKVARAFRGLNCGDAGDAQHVAFLGRAGENKCQRFRFHEDAAGRAGDTSGFGLGADVDHMGLAGIVEMSQSLVSHGIYVWLRWAGMAISRLRYHSTMHLSQRFFAALLACTLALQPVAADELPELGDAASNDLSLSTEKKIGQQIMHEIRWREPSYLDDADVEAYLNQLGGRLAAVSNDPGFGFYFFPINDRNINAFAMPGGYIGMHTGLIVSAQTESELAGVLAHEIAHVTQRHIARQVFQSKKIGTASLVAMGLALLAARSSGQMAGAAIATTQAGAISAQLAFSRDFEREADRQGFDILRKAGFDVRGMGVFFERLQKAVRLYENNATAYLRTHPLTGERLTDMQNREQGVPYRQVADSIDFQLVRAKVRAMDGTPGDAVKDLDKLLRERKFASEPAIRFGLAFALYRNRDWNGAEREIETIRRLKVSAPMLEHLRGDIRIAQGDAAGGLTVYRDAMVRSPLNLGLLYGYGGALLGTRRYDEALRFAEAQLGNYPGDIRLHRMRAESYAGLGRRAMQHRALAEAFALQGQTAGAIEQLEQAQKAGDANFFEMSSIDARLRELRQRLIDELKDKRNY